MRVPIGSHFGRMAQRILYRRVRPWSLALQYRSASTRQAWPERFCGSSGVTFRGMLEPGVCDRNAHAMGAADPHVARARAAVEAPDHARDRTPEAARKGSARAYGTRSAHPGAGRCHPFMASARLRCELADVSSVDPGAVRLCGAAMPPVWLLESPDPGAARLLGEAASLGPALFISR